ncbi:MAG: hypothetical protein ABW061_14605, partial [Polyangiaceae bacterium]
LTRPIRHRRIRQRRRRDPVPVLVQAAEDGGVDMGVHVVGTPYAVPGKARLQPVRVQLSSRSSSSFWRPLIRPLFSRLRNTCERNDQHFAIHVHAPSRSSLLIMIDCVRC